MLGALDELCDPTGSHAELLCTGPLTAEPGTEPTQTFRERSSDCPASSPYSSRLADTACSATWGKTLFLILTWPLPCSFPPHQWLHSHWEKPMLGFVGLVLCECWDMSIFWWRGQGGRKNSNSKWMSTEELGAPAKSVLGTCKECTGQCPRKLTHNPPELGGQPGSSALISDYRQSNSPIVF